MHRHICFDKGGIKENKSRCCCREKVKDEYIRKMIEKTSTLKVGMPNNQTSDIVCLVSEEAALKYQKGMNPDFTIGTTKSGKPRINKNADDTLYMMLSAEGGYTRRGNGTIKVLTSQKEKFEVMARGNRADGDAGKDLLPSGLHPGLL